MFQHQFSGLYGLRTQLGVGLVAIANIVEGFVDYKGFPKKCKWFSVFSSSQFPDQVSLPLRGSMKKMADCETTTGHVGHPARTLMKDARRGLNR